MRNLLVTVISIVLLFSVSSLQASAASERIAGKHRYETTVGISNKGWNKSSTVILAVGDNFPDALAGGPLAYKLDAPILLSKKNELGSDTQKEIKRLGAKNAIILGSTSVITRKVDNQLKSMGLSVKRIGGKDRYETAALIAKELGASSKAIVAYGRNFPDALAIAPYAARQGYPILLSETNKLPAVTKSALIGKSETIFVGGSSILSNSLLKATTNPKRIAGADRYATAATIIKTFQMNASNAYVATGQNFADALTGSVLAAKNNGAMVLVQPDKLPTAIKSLLGNKKFVNTIALGSTGAVSKNVMEDIDELLENNTLQKASQIQVNTKYTANLKRSSDVDYYKFKLNKPGNIIIQMEQKPGYSWYGAIIDKDGTSLQRINTDDGTYASGVTNYSVGLPAGEYYFKVDSKYSGYKAPYSFTLNFKESNYYEKESNNTLGTAQTVEVNKDYRGVIQNSSDSDFYKFTLNQPGEVVLKIDTKPGKAWSGELLSASGNKYTDFSTEYGAYASGPTHVQVGLPKGTYYFKIDYNRYETIQEEYKFQVQYTQGNNFEKEFNNSIETANPINLKEYYKGSIAYTDRNDFYKFSLPNDGQIKVHIKREVGISWRVRIINKEGEEFLNFTTGYDSYAEGETNIPVGLPAGDYYIVISEYRNAGHKDYQFKLGYEQGNNIEKEFNNNVQSANKIKLGTRYYGSIQYAGDYDYYSFDLSETATVTLKALNLPDSGWRYEIVDNQGNRKKRVYTDYSDYASGDGEVAVSLGAGRYYIKVSNYSDAVFETYSFVLNK